MFKNGQIGISVVICCHNSAAKLPITLKHLQKQQVGQEIAWEVLVIDNASSDDTSKLARTIWDEAPVTTLRVVCEKRLGLVFARLTGFVEARYDVVSFVDDDNWVDENWIAILSGVMRNDARIGACGGLNSPVFEGTKPYWFDTFQRSFAVGTQESHIGDITAGAGVLCGAGLSVRKAAWDQLKDNGFEFTLTGRKGNQLLCGEDYELCLAIKLAGWKIWYEPALQLQHYLPKSRLNWRHLRRMIRGYGFTKTRLAAYGYGDKQLHELGRCSWGRVFWRISKKLIRQPIKSIFSQFLQYEGDQEVTVLDIKFGELKEILTLRASYPQYFARVRNAAWNQSNTRP